MIVVKAQNSKMKKSPIVVFCILLFIASQAQEKAKVLVLGSYHMGNPGLDSFNMEADDVMVPKRQKEIEDFVNLLATFKPTIICLEVKLDRQQKLTENYQAYLNGKAELRKNEIDQVGFRLAKKMKHAQVYAIDADAPFDMDTVVKVAQQYQFTSFLELIGKIPEFMKGENEKLHKSTITQYYQYMNTDEYAKMSHGFYLDMAVIGKGDNYAGADLVADWYQRNLRIYRNLQALQLKPEDRVLILYGAGHAKILQDLVEDSSNLKLIKLNELK